MKTAPYHHGALREALLTAAEAVLRRDGVSGLTLRAISREAGVTHTAAIHHFQDLTGLLSELAAVGFQRFAEALRKATMEPGRSISPGGQAYVRFAVENPDLFQLMFRSERLQATRPALCSALSEAFHVLTGLRGVDPHASSLPELGDLAAAWSLVHGFAVLLIADRFKPMLDAVPGGGDYVPLLEAALQASGLVRSRNRQNDTRSEGSST